MVDQNFLSFEANRIKAIPLCWTDQCDRIIWPDSPDGEYSVKAGYQKLCEEADASNASSSDPTHQKSFWKKVWKLQFPNKIKNFLWRVCSNALPTKENLKKRKIIEDARCSACLSEQESTFHAIWDCEKISHVWAPCFSWVRTEHPQIHDIQELINMLGQQVQKLELFGVVAWFIWNHRNRLRLNEKGLSSEKIFEVAKIYLSDYQEKCPTPRMKLPKGNFKWQPPEDGMYKTNYDGAVFTESGEAGIGVNC
ncbi:putative ribonuclease H protein At1g65750 [Quercus suber]|uniref:putative ribonuclease H protein At1g65750 n=1 Tax=Quercus suber TaxID=58331 RepID=UPI0032DF030B